MSMKKSKKQLKKETQNIAFNIITNMKLLNSTQNMLHVIATMKAKFLFIILENVDFNEFNEMYMSDLEAVVAPYYCLKEYSRLSGKNIDPVSYNLLKHYACVYCVVYKIDNIINKDIMNEDKLENINRMLKQTLEEYKYEASKSEKSNLILQEILTDILYSNMKKFGLITDAELEELMK